MIKYFGKGEAYGDRALCQITDINPAARLIHCEDDRVMCHDWVAVLAMSGADVCPLRHLARGLIEHGVRGAQV